MSISGSWGKKPSYISGEYLESRCEEGTRIESLSSHISQRSGGRSGLISLCNIYFHKKSTFNYSSENFFLPFHSRGVWVEDTLYEESVSWGTGRRHKEFLFFFGSASDAVPSSFVSSEEGGGTMSTRDHAKQGVFLLLLLHCTSRTKTIKTTESSVSGHGQNTNC